VTDEDALRSDVGAVVIERDALAVRGPDALTFLQGQLSQELATVAVGDSVDSLLLQPTGRMVALLRVTRREDDEFVLDADGGAGPLVLERLNRFKLRTKADLEPLDWACVALRGPRAHAVAPDGLPADWPGWPGVDLLGPAVEPPADVRRCSPEAYEAVRIEMGVPRTGAEIDERTIPAEAGVVLRAVSFSKGCYTGQELVARIDSRGGNVPRRLRRLVLAGPAVPAPGAEVTVEGKVVGEVTSAAWSEHRGAPVALAYLARAVEVPAEVVVRVDGGDGPALAEALHGPAADEG
jgi:folate-binding protein YgfZ